MTFDSLWSRWETVSRVCEREKQLRGGLELQWVSVGEGGELNKSTATRVNFKCAGQLEQLYSHPGTNYKSPSVISFDSLADDLQVFLREVSTG